MATFNGTYTSTVTLTASKANATLSTTGLINAYGPAGVSTISINGTLTPATLSAALFAPAGITANITNLGTIESHGTDASNMFDAGIVLGAPGNVTNAGLVEGAAGIFIGGGQDAAGTRIINTGAVEGTASVGIVLTGTGVVRNDGTVSGVLGGVLELGTNASYFSYLLNTGSGVITATGTTSQAGSAVQLDGGAGVILGNEGIITGYGGGAELRARNLVAVYNLGKISSTGSGSGGFAGLSIAEDTIANAGARISNSSSGVISGQYGIEIYQRGTSTSPGTMVNSVSNAGMIMGAQGAGIADWSGSALVINTGSILSALQAVGTNHSQVGVEIGGIGTVYNDTGAMISGDWGVELGNGTVFNAGTIDGLTAPLGTVNNYAAIYLQTGGAVFNTVSGTIDGASGVIIGGNGSAAVYNAGTIIGASSIGVDLRSGGTVFDSGLIAGQTEALYMGSGTDLLVLGAGASFGGSIVANSTASATLELASGSSAGTFDMGGTVSGFNNIVFDTGSSWTLEGNLAELGGREIISGFGGGDTLVLEGFTATSDQPILIGGTDTYALVLFDGSSMVQIDLVGSFAANEITFSAVGAGTEIHLCYLRGTNIHTPEGERPVESLSAGDEVLTRYAGRQRIKWIGRQDYAGRFIAANPDKIPVRILAGALGEGLPARDLSLSPGHAVLLEETLVLAQSLVNGITVRQDEVPELVEYYAIELDAHDCVIAEGVHAESFADGPGLRNQFHNIAEFHSLFPDYAEPDEIALCAPRPERGPELDAVLRPIVARAAAGTAPGALRGFVDLIEEDGLVEGWAQDMANPELPVLLEIRRGSAVLGTVLACDKREDLAAAGIGKGWAMFSCRVPGGLTGEARHGISVHRAGDGAVVPLSGDCQARIGLRQTRAA